MPRVQTKPQNEPVNAPAPEGQERYKLLWIGQKETGRETHASGRSGHPTYFVPSVDDNRPHAMVTRAFGEHLIEVDRGEEDSPRYKWDREALKAFEKLDAEAEQ